METVRETERDTTMTMFSLPKSASDTSPEAKAFRCDCLRWVAEPNTYLEIGESTPEPSVPSWSP